MATVTAKATGNWSSGSTWSTDPNLPAAGDDVDSNGYTVTIDQNITVASLINSNAGAGGFTVSAARTIAANITATVRTVLTCSHTSGTVAITGTITGGSGSAAYGVNVTGSGGTTSITASGGITGGSSSGHGVYIGANATVNITGDCTGGSANTACGVYNNSTGTTAITGNVTSGSGLSNYGAQNRSSGTITVSGTATGATAYGLVNYAGGTASCNKAVASSTVAGLASNNANGLTTYKIAEDASNGSLALSGYCKLAVDATANYHRVYNSTGGSYTDLSNDYPAATDVKNGVAYDRGALTGTYTGSSGGGSRAYQVYGLEELH